MGSFDFWLSAVIFVCLIWYMVGGMRSRNEIYKVVGLGKLPVPAAISLCEAIVLLQKKRLPIVAFVVLLSATTFLSTGNQIQIFLCVALASAFFFETYSWYRELKLYKRTAKASMKS